MQINLRFTTEICQKDFNQAPSLEHTPKCQSNFDMVIHSHIEMKKHWHTFIDKNYGHYTKEIHSSNKAMQFTKWGNLLQNDCHLKFP